MQLICGHCPSRVPFRCKGERAAAFLANHVYGHHTEVPVELISCEEFGEHLSGYLRGTLDPETDIRMRFHIEPTNPTGGCKGCRQDVLGEIETGDSAFTPSSTKL